MKRFCLFSMLLIILLAACSPSGAGAECNKEGVCVRLEVKGPVQSLTPTPFTITIKTEKDISGLGISIYGDYMITISGIEKKPEGAELTYQDQRSMGWSINTKSGVEYTFSGQVVFPKPTVSYGVFNYMLGVAANHPSIARITDFVRIYLDASGKQIEESKVKMALETDYPLPTSRPDVTIIPPTPYPTLVRPSATPLPSPTPTLKAYPAPGEKGNTDPNKNQPTPTLAAYPKP